MILGELTMEEFKRALKKTKTLIVPFGAVEAHGRHLPLDTDTRIMREVAEKASQRAGVFTAPPVQYGVCTSTGAHPGTIGITCESLRMLVKDIVRDGCRKGLRNFILISGHGGGLHVSALREAGEALIREMEGIKIAALSVYELIGKEVRDISETKDDSHAGEVETSLMLYLAPELVKGRSKEEYPRLPRPVIARDKMKYWPGAVWGNPAKASKEKGEKMFGIMVDKVVLLIREAAPGR
ncbi:MAG: creatininase family protein [Deltaproteobacteria bacterium]|nr:creatininase family protein [Deltaproteobacteria bacterium]